MMYLDLDELPTLFNQYWFWSSNHFAPAWFRRKDHLFDPTKNIKSELKELIHQETGKSPQGPIRLLTHLRYFGYCFNPISLYYCFDKEGVNLEFIVAEVHNTPWGKRHCYVLHENLNEHSDSKLRFEHKKAFHVSPFLHMEMHYHWRMAKPNKNLVCHIENHSSEERVFDATLALKRKEISSTALIKTLLIYPLITWKIIILIHYQALCLWLKKIPYIPYPKSSTHTSADRK